MSISSLVSSPDACGLKARTQIVEGCLDGVRFTGWLGVCLEARLRKST